MSIALRDALRLAGNEGKLEDDADQTYNEEEDFQDEYGEAPISTQEVTDEQIRSLVKIGPPILTRFEKARILGTRSLQLSMSAPALVDFEEDKDKELTDPLLIASAELEAKVLPISIRRYLPDGRFQDIPLQFLYLDWSRKARFR